MELKDLFLTPLYLIFIYAVAIIIRNRFYANSPLKKYFLPALTAKIIGAISTGLIYQFYYDGGDTFFFYQISSVIWKAFLDDPAIAFKLFLRESSDYTPSPESGYVHEFYSWYFKEKAAFFVSKVAAFFGLFCFNTYSVIACFFAFLSFIGLWLFFITVTEIFPGLDNKLAIAIFFVPSVCFWGSGIFKDTLSLAGIGALTYCSYNIFINKKYSLFNIVVFFLSAYCVYISKVYILFCFLPAALLWVFRNFQSRIKSKFITIFFAPIIIIITVFVSYQTIQNLISSSNKYSLDKAIYTIQATQEWHTVISPEGSAYSLGTYDPTITGIISKFPAAINVTLFRPYVWEATGLIMFISALESLIIFFFTAKVIWKSGLFKSIKLVNKTPFLIFSIVFSLTLAFIVGFTTYNFGALVRYKIPILPFYLASIFIIQHIAQQRKGVNN